MKEFLQRILKILSTAEPFSGIFILLALFAIAYNSLDSQKLQVACMTVGFAAIFAYVSHHHNRRQLKFELFKRRMELMGKISEGYDEVNELITNITFFKSKNIDPFKEIKKSLLDLNKWGEVIHYKVLTEIVCLFKNEKLEKLYTDFIKSGDAVLDKNEKDENFDKSYNKLFDAIVKESRLF